jgi:hypothetical protein
MCAGVQIARLSLTFSPNIAQEKTGHLLLFAESSPTQTILSTYPTSLVLKLRTTPTPEESAFFQTDGAL